MITKTFYQSSIAHFMLPEKSRDYSIEIENVHSAQSEKENVEKKNLFKKHDSDAGRDWGQEEKGDDRG